MSTLHEFEADLVGLSGLRVDDLSSSSMQYIPHPHFIGGN